jgi:hypothetical protein
MRLLPHLGYLKSSQVTCSVYSHNLITRLFSEGLNNVHVYARSAVQQKWVWFQIRCYSLYKKTVNCTMDNPVHGTLSISLSEEACFNGEGWGGATQIQSRLSVLEKVAYIRLRHTECPEFGQCQRFPFLLTRMKITKSLAT